MAPNPDMLTVVLGSAAYGNREPYVAEDDIKKAFDVLDKHGVTHIDTAQIYGKSQAALGKAHAGDRFTLDTKWGGPFDQVTGKCPPWATKEFIVRTAKESIAALGVKQVDIFYLHFPDKDTPLEDTLAGVDEVHRLGLFRRFGLSNFVAADVQRAYDIAKAKGYVLPTVYQGNYNAVARRAETEILPTLRKLGLSYYAYSPIAGGLLAKSAADIAAGKGRFEAGGMYARVYGKPSILASLDTWEQIAKDEGVVPAELAYRWIAGNSALKNEHGDKLIVGGSSLAQLDETLTRIQKGPLSAKAAAAIDQIWETIKHEAPLDNFNP